MGVVTLGLDIGQRVDPTALAVVETERRPVEGAGHSDVHHLIRYLERQPLGTPYPEVVSRVVAVTAGLAGRVPARPDLYIDAALDPTVAPLFGGAAA